MKWSRAFKNTETALLILLLIAVSLSAQERVPVPTDDVDFENKPVTNPGSAYYVELGGKPFLSFNADFRISDSKRFSVGLQPLPAIMPNVMIYFLEGSGNKFFEGGLGLSLIIGHGMLFHGVLGYRYQKPGGLIFRAGFTPVFFSDPDSEIGFLPMVGISLGYSK